MNKSVKVPVFHKDGTIIGYVSRQATSVGASKLAGAPVGMERHPKLDVYGWRVQ